VGLISSAGGVQGLQAVNTMEFVVRSLRGFAVPLVVPVARAKRSFGEGGQPLDERLEAQLLSLGHEVALTPPGRPGAQDGRGLSGRGTQVTGVEAAICRFAHGERRFNSEP